MTNFIGYVGTYTKKISEGIYRFVLNTDDEKITDVQLAASVQGPTYLTVSEDNRFLYAVKKEGGLGGIVAYSVDSQTGELKELNSELYEGASPCHVSVDYKTQYVLSANYHKGTVELYDVVEENGKLKELLSEVKHEGSGPNKERQEKPHVHFAGFTPDEKYVVAIDLGTDIIATYEIRDGSLHEVNRLTTKPGSGPRHIVFHPNGKYAYVMTELSSEVIVLQYHQNEGIFKEVQYISTIPDEFVENNQGSAIHITSDGKFVYAGNRGHNSIAVFQTEPSGELSFVEHIYTEGDWPRDFSLDPTEQYIVASNQESNNLVLYKRDSKTGKLTLLQSNITVPEPVCVKFLQAER